MQLSVATSFLVLVILQIGRAHLAPDIVCLFFPAFSFDSG